ncbi:unnamed protein product [Schistosoma rodhaini]|uniref:Cassette chromosome recombinase b n=1 Tax=Schistosoma rodhaini TaxID=6188 RepID=A0A183QRI4_9TREM|nr:unnamed protein product [Schistosoma rodhaini]CAH8533235.1 unnamed protein product [Schistosoma rodhaini]
MFDDSVSDVALADFQILESPCVDVPFDRGPQFHLNLQCRTCESFKETFVCCDCVRKDSIFSKKSGKISFPQNSDRIVAVRKSVNELNRKIKVYEPILFKSVFHTFGRIEELNVRISSLEHTIEFLTKMNSEKRKKLQRVRQAMTRCHTSSQQLLKQQANLVRHFITVAQRKKLLVADLDIVNRQIKHVHDTYFEELLGVYFVTDLSTDSLSPDRFVCSPLHIDKENIFAGPEPTPSSHTALTYCSVAIRVSTILLDVWLPVSIRRNLHLVGSFLSALPQRDDMGRVYFAVIYAVHLLCQCRGIDIKNGLEQLGINVIPGRHTLYNPLFGLYCLGNLVSHNNKSTRYFDECYSIKLDGLFGKIPSLTLTSQPTVSFSSPCFVEKGEEVDEMFDLSNDDNLTLSNKQVNRFALYRTSSSDYVQSSNKLEEHDSSVGLECWELVSVTSPVEPRLCETTMINAGSMDSTQYPGPLSKVWRLAKGIIGTSEPSDCDE